MALDAQFQPGDLVHIVLYFIRLISIKNEVNVGTGNAEQLSLLGLPAQSTRAPLSAHSPWQILKT